VNPIFWELDGGAVVRSFMPDDADTLAGVIEANAERLSRWMPWVEESRRLEGARAFIERARASEVDLEGNGIWVDRGLVGAIGMSVDTVANGSEIGYWVDEGFEGRGIVTTACRRFIDHAFRTLDLHRVTIRAAVENTRSRAVAERLGFRQEGVMRGAGRVGGDRYVDLVVYGMLQDEWPSTR
jgi:ribosomal-protein-serine acetyltransferase